MPSGHSLAATAAAVLALLCGGPAAAAALGAESPNPPRHLVDYHLDWLNYISPDDLPPSRAAVCIVDSGLAVTPDTPPSDPTNGPILYRLSTDGGPGEPQGNDPARLHGTRMAAAAIAPVNDWGTIGETSWGRVVSVRAMVEGETTFREDAYRRGIAICRNQVPSVDVAAVNLSLDYPGGFSDGELAALDDAVARAHNSGVSVVAAAGNSAKSPTQPPANLDGVFAVAAGGADGRLCDYATFDAAVDVIGPGCAVDTAEPLTGTPALDDRGGSSAAAITVSVLIAALRTLRPDAGYQTVEAWIRDSARDVDGRRVLDGEAAARLAGLSDVVDRARARVPAPTGAVQSEAPAPAPEAALAPANPSPPAQAVEPHNSRPAHRVSARWSRGRLMVSTTRKPARTWMQVDAVYVGELGASRRRVRRRIRSATLVLKLGHKPDLVIVRFVPIHEFGRAPSRPVRLRATRSGRFE